MPSTRFSFVLRLAPAIAALTLAGGAAAQGSTGEVPATHVPALQADAQDSSRSAPPPLMTVGEIRRDPDSRNLPRMLGQRVRVRGVLTADRRAAGAESDVANLQDGTGGIVIFVNDTTTLKAFAPGDSLEVTGHLEHQDGMEEIRAEEIRRLGRARVPDPLDVNARDLLGERFAGRLVRITGRVDLHEGEAVVLHLGDTTGSVPVYIRRSYLEDREFASGLYGARRATVVGIAAQEDEETPFTGGYDLLPRGPQDFHFEPAPPYRALAWTAVLLLLFGLALSAWLRRVRAERRVDTLSRLTRDLERRDAIMEAVAFAGARFLEGDDLERSLDLVVTRLVDATEADSGAVVRFGETEAEAPSDARSPIHAIFRDATGAAELRSRLAEGSMIRRSGEPADSESRLAGPGLGSIILVPVSVGGSLWGALGLYSRGPAPAGSIAEDDALRAAAAMIGAAVERRATVEALREREEQLRQAQKLEAIGRLAGGIAHDFNNLLTVLAGNAAFLAEGEDLDDDRRAAADQIVRSVERGSSLARQLLAFGRRQALPSRTQALGAAIDEMRPMLTRLIGERVTLETRLEEDGWIAIPPGQLEQIMMSLCVNASEAMPDGGLLRIRTRRSQAAHGGQVVVEVSDTGAGMDNDTLSRAFEPFFTTREAASGLGLSLVYGIVTQANGSMDIKSTPGRGTRVTLTLPAARPPDHAVATAGRERTRPATILLVEDEAPVRFMARRILEGAGHRVLEATDGANALHVLAHHGEPIDLVVTDVRMPEMSGADLAAELPRLGYDCPILFMSGYAAEDLELGDLEPERYMEKPFTPDQLRERVALMLLKTVHAG